jgi:hypothetical protein
MHSYKDKDKPLPVIPRRAVHTYGVPHLVLLLFLILVSFPDLWRHSLRGLHGHATTSSRFCFRRHLTTPAQLQANVDHLMVPTDPRAPGLDLRSSHTFKHALVNRQCPRYVMALQNENAGVGHRLREWAMGLWAATLWNLTLVHFPLLNTRGGLTPEHGLYVGWDEIYGLRVGENRTSNYWNTQPTVTELIMKTFQYRKFTVPTEQGVAFWAHLGDEAECGMIYLLPGNNWVYDASAPIKDIMAYKFLQASRRGHAWAQPLLNPAAINVAVHYRRGDMVPTSETTLWSIVVKYVLPAFREVGLVAPIELHIFADGGAVGDMKHFVNAPPSDKQQEKGKETGGDPLPPLPKIVYHFDTDSRITLWNMAHSDVFIGSKSSFSWAVGMVSSQPYCLMQTGDPEHQFCPHGAGCCTGDGVCSEEAVAGLKATALRLAKLHLEDGECAGWAGETLGGSEEIEYQYVGPNATNAP